MRGVLVGVAVVVVLHASIASAEWASPQLAAVAKKPATAAGFWKRVVATGTPLVEDVGDPSGKVLVTFVYRASPGMKAVAMLGAPGRHGGHAQLARVPRTDIFAWSTLVDPAARMAYSFLPNDNAGTPDPMKPDPKRFANLSFDPLSKTPLDARQSAVSLPKAPPPSPWLVPKAATPTGELVSFTVKTKALAGERRISIYTPPRFSTKASPYPLVVMFDEAAALSRLGIQIQLDELIAAKRIPPVVVLLVGAFDRTKELQDNPTFADYVALDLVPWVRTRFNATSDPSRAAIAGISLGGLAAAYIAGRHPDVFGNVLSQSGSFWWGPDQPESTARELAAKPALPIRFWLEAGALETSAGDPSLLTANRHLRDVLQARGYTYVYSEFVGGHQYINWRHTIANGLIAVLTPPAGPPPKHSTKLAKPREPAIDVSPVPPAITPVLVRRALLDSSTVIAWLDAQPSSLATEDAVNSAVYTLAGITRMREGLVLAEWNAKKFPTSANVHDTLAELLFLNGDTKRAIAEYQLAFSLDPKNVDAKRMSELLRKR